MNNDELNDLILCIKLQAKDDHLAGIYTTIYSLPEAALSEDVREALIANFEHYAGCSINGKILTLIHPKSE